MLPCAHSCAAGARLGACVQQEGRIPAPTGVPGAGRHPRQKVRASCAEDEAAYNFLLPPAHGRPFLQPAATIAICVLWIIRQRQARNGAGSNKDKTTDEDDLYDEEEMFLRLDDVLEGWQHLPSRCCRLSHPALMQEFDAEESMSITLLRLAVGKDIDMDEGTSPQITRPMPTPAMLLALDTAG